MSFPNVIHGSEEELANTYSSEYYPVGSKMEIEDGRIFRFAEAAGTALVTGKVVESSAPTTNFTDEAIATLAAGITSLTGVGATAGDCAASLLKYGYIWSSTAANLNPIMRVKDNTLISAGSTGTVTLFNPTIDAFAEAETVSYIPNPWRDIVVTTNATALSLAVGVPHTAIALNQYGWVQTRGPARVLIVGTVVLNNPVILAATSGGVGPAVSQTTNLTGVVGRCITVEATTEYGPIFLTLE